MAIYIFLKRINSLLYTPSVTLFFRKNWFRANFQNLIENFNFLIGWQDIQILQVLSNNYLIFLKTHFELQTQSRLQNWFTDLLSLVTFSPKILFKKTFLIQILPAVVIQQLGKRFHFMNHKRHRRSHTHDLKSLNLEYRCDASQEARLLSAMMN